VETATTNLIYGTVNPQEDVVQTRDDVAQTIFRHP